jgi:hypothetical protein
MTCFREGYCRVCGAHSQGVHIDSPGICTPCASKFKYPRSLVELARNRKDLDPEFSKVVDKHFWELV